MKEYICTFLVKHSMVRSSQNQLFLSAIKTLTPNSMRTREPLGKDDPERTIGKVCIGRTRTGAVSEKERDAH